MHSRDIMPAYLPMDKQVIENPHETYTETHIFFIHAIFKWFMHNEFVCRCVRKKLKKQEYLCL